MTTSKNAKPRTFLILLAVSTLIGSTGYAAVLGTDVWPVSAFLSILLMLLCTGKVLGAGLMVSGRKIGWIIYLISALGFAFTWFGAAWKQVSEFRSGMDTGISSDPSMTPLGNSPVIGLLVLLVPAVIWILLYRSQRRHFVH